MYTIVLAAVLTTGNAAPAADIYEDIRDLKREVEGLRQDQSQFRAEALKLVIAGLRQRLTDEKLDELRRDIRTLKYEEVVTGVPLHMPGVTSLEPVGNRTVVSLQVPAGATFYVNDKEVTLLTTNPSFITPPLETGKDYYYDFKVTVTEDGKAVTRIKRVKVRAGGVVQLNYADMEAR
ncbi:MAG TPA: TIGR03000 domain-containing protein [Gemmataceae bacterium]|jgi:uncharacterized protein (TIGR03000 family)